MGDTMTDDRAERAALAVTEQSRASVLALHLAVQAWWGMQLAALLRAGTPEGKDGTNVAGR